MRLRVVMRFTGTTNRPNDDFGVLNRIIPVVGVVVDKQILTIELEAEDELSHQAA